MKNMSEVDFKTTQACEQLVGCLDFLLCASHHYKLKLEKIHMFKVDMPLLILSAREDFDLFDLHTCTCLHMYSVIWIIVSYLDI